MDSHTIDQSNTPKNAQPQQTHNMHIQSSNNAVPSSTSNHPNLPSNPESNIITIDIPDPQNINAHQTPSISKPNQAQVEQVSGPEIRDHQIDNMIKQVALPNENQVKIVNIPQNLEKSRQVIDLDQISNQKMVAQQKNNEMISEQKVLQNHSSKQNEQIGKNQISIQQAAPQKEQPSQQVQSANNPKSEMQSQPNQVKCTSVIDQLKCTSVIANDQINSIEPTSCQHHVDQPNLESNSMIQATPIEHQTPVFQQQHILLSSQPVSAPMDNKINQVVVPCQQLSFQQQSFNHVQNPANQPNETLINNQIAAQVPCYQQKSILNSIDLAQINKAEVKVCAGQKIYNICQELPEPKYNIVNISKQNIQVYTFQKQNNDIMDVSKSIMAQNQGSIQHQISQQQQEINKNEISSLNIQSRIQQGNINPPENQLGNHNLHKDPTVPNAHIDHTLPTVRVDHTVPTTHIDPSLNAESSVLSVPTVHADHPVTSMPVEQHENGANSKTISQQPVNNVSQSPELTDIDEIRKMLLTYLPPHLKELTQSLDDKQLRQMYLDIRAQQMRLAQQNIQNNQFSDNPDKKDKKEASQKNKSNSNNGQVQRQQNRKKDQKKKENTKKSVTNSPPRQQAKESFDKASNHIQSHHQPNSESMMQPQSNRPKKIRKQKKRVVTTVVQQIQYFDDSDCQNGPNKMIVMDNGQAKRKKPSNKGQMQNILAQLCSLVKSLDLASLNSSSNGVS